MFWEGRQTAGGDEVERGSWKMIVQGRGGERRSEEQRRRRREVVWRVPDLCFVDDFDC